MIEGKQVTAILLIAGNSTRYGQNRNKNFEIIDKKPVIFYSLAAFEENEYIDDIIIGSKKKEKSRIEKILKEEKIKKPIKIIEGGASRQETVYHCIQNTKADFVLIHDGARPLLKQQYISQCIESMKEWKGVTIGVPSKDTIKITNEEGIVIQTTKRNHTWAVQTPQCFERKTLLRMHEKYKQEKVTDDCMLLEKEGEKIKIIKGDYTNIKITTYEDLKTIKGFLGK